MTSARNFSDPALLHRLRRFVEEHPTGGYVFVCIDSPTAAQELVRQLTALPVCATLTTAVWTTEILGNEYDHLAQIAGQKPAAIWYKGLNEAVLRQTIDGYEYQKDPLYALNFIRESIRALGVPLIFEVNTLTLQAITQYARDLYAQRDEMTLYAERSRELTLGQGEFITSSHTQYLPHAKANDDPALALLHNQYERALTTKLSPRYIARAYALPLAELYVLYNRYDDAKPLLPYLHKYLPQTFALQRRLAELYVDGVAYKEAQQQYQHIENTLINPIKEDKTHQLSIADFYNTYAEFLYTIGEYGTSTAYVEKALVIHQQILPATHPDLASSYDNVGTAYYAMGDMAKSLAYQEKALEIRQQILPATHPDLAQSYNNVGSAYKAMGDITKGLAYQKKALEIWQQILPAMHPNLATSYSNVGMAYQAMGDVTKGLAYQEKALAIRQQILPATHPDLATSYMNIGVTYAKLERYAESLDYARKALAIYQQHFDNSHPQVAELLEAIPILEEISSAGF